MDQYSAIFHQAYDNVASYRKLQEKLFEEFLRPSFGSTLSSDFKPLDGRVGFR